MMVKPTKLTKPDFAKKIREQSHKEPNVYEWRGMWKHYQIYDNVNIVKMLESFCLLKGQENFYDTQRRATPEDHAELEGKYDFLKGGRK
jgi:hypothetical protein